MSFGDDAKVRESCLLRGDTSNKPLEWTGHHRFTSGTRCSLPAIKGAAFRSNAATSSINVQKDWNLSPQPKRVKSMDQHPPLFSRSFSDFFDVLLRSVDKACTVRYPYPCPSAPEKPLSERSISPDLIQRVVIQSGSSVRWLPCVALTGAWHGPGSWQAGAEPSSSCSSWPLPGRPVCSGLSVGRLMWPDGRLPSCAGGWPC